MDLCKHYLDMDSFFCELMAICGHQITDEVVINNDHYVISVPKKMNGIIEKMSIATPDMDVVLATKQVRELGNEVMNVINEYMLSLGFCSCITCVDTVVVRNDIEDMSYVEGELSSLIGLPFKIGSGLTLEDARMNCIRKKQGDKYE